MLLLLIMTGRSTVRYFVEKPRYDVLQDDGRLEIRRYDPVVVAEVESEGARYEAAENAFRPLADYIFGENSGGQKIAMTSPVSQQASEQKGEKIAMTSPVTQLQTEEGRWRVQFTMPSRYKLSDLPKPKNPAVRLREVPSKTFAAIRFSGSAKDDSVKVKLEKLRAYVKTSELETIGKPVYAYYDPPWTIPFLRRNEMLIEIGLGKRENSRRS